MSKVHIIIFRNWNHKVKPDQNLRGFLETSPGFGRIETQSRWRHGEDQNIKEYDQLKGQIIWKAALGGERIQARAGL